MPWIILPNILMKQDRPANRRSWQNWAAQKKLPQNCYPVFWIKNWTQKIPRGNTRLFLSCPPLFLTLCAAPVAAPMALALLALLFAGLLVLACGILCVFLFSLSFAVIGMITIGKGVTALPLSVPGFCLLTGGGLLTTGFAILLLFAGIFICRWIFVVLARSIQQKIKKRTGGKQHA